MGRGSRVHTPPLPLPGAPAGPRQPPPTPSSLRVVLAPPCGQSSKVFPRRCWDGQRSLQDPSAFPLLPCPWPVASAHPSFPASGILNLHFLNPQILRYGALEAALDETGRGSLAMAPAALWAVGGAAVHSLVPPNLLAVGASQTMSPGPGPHSRWAQLYRVPGRLSLSSTTHPTVHALKSFFYLLQDWRPSLGLFSVGKLRLQEASFWNTHSKSGLKPRVPDFLSGSPGKASSPYAVWDAQLTCCVTLEK